MYGKNSKNNDSKVDRANSFVKEQNAKMESMMAEKPKKSEEAYKFDAYMCNDGEHAKDFANKLTKDLDKKAFPVK